MATPQVSIFSFVLEDDPDMLESVEEILRRNKIEIYRLFDSAYKFLEDLSADIHVCLIDHYLTGGATGLEVLREIKKRSPNSFVIVCSGQRNFDVVVEYLNECADRYVDKNKFDYLIKLEQYLTQGLDLAKKRLEEMQLLTQRKAERDAMFKKLGI